MTDKMKDNKDAESGEPVQLDKEEQQPIKKPGQQEGGPQQRPPQQPGQRQGGPQQGGPQQGGPQHEGGQKR